MALLSTRGILVASILAALPGAASAMQFIVTKTADTADGVCDADCSLREAVIAANTAPGADIIRLRHSLYRITRADAGEEDDDARTGDLDLSEDVLILGSPDRSTLDAAALSRGFEILPGATVEIVDVTVRNGYALSRGGGIDNAGDLTLRRVWLNSNRLSARPPEPLRGGGIHNTGVLRMIFCRVQSNVAHDSTTPIGGFGGGIYNGSVMFMYDTVVRYNLSGTDVANGFGGGLYSVGPAHIDRSYFGHNSAGRGEGSAIANRTYRGSLFLGSSTVSANGHDGAASAVVNGTRADPQERQPKAYLLNATIADNNGGGLLNTGRLFMRNTIIGGNYAQSGSDRWYDAGANCRNERYGSLGQTFSLVGSDGNCPASVVTDNRRFFLEVLEPLRYLGGPSAVHALRPGPYAIDAGDPQVCPDRDQRGARRPADGDLNGSELCDIGAMEVGADE